MPLPPSSTFINGIPISSSIYSSTSTSMHLPMNDSIAYLPPLVRRRPVIRPILSPERSKSSYLSSTSSLPKRGASYCNMPPTPIIVPTKFLRNYDLNSHPVSRSNSSEFSFSRSPSPYSFRSTTPNNSVRAQSVTSSSRRIFPQTYQSEKSLNLNEYNCLEQAPVVYDANLSFDIGATKQKVRSSLRPSPAFNEPETASNYLSDKIQNFLKRTDHVTEEWQKSLNGSSRCSSVVDDERFARSKSVQNIMIRSQRYKSVDLPPTSSRASSILQDCLSQCGVDDYDDDDKTLMDDELSEMAVDLTEEHSASNMTSERLEAETSERFKLEKEIQEQQSKIKHLQDTSEKLEMELICAKSDLNGVSDDEDVENDENAGVHKLKYERVARELEFTKRRLQTQHSHDLEQLVGLKKQLEKKLADAYEEVEEQRQVVGQWKRKTQKMTNEMNDLRMLLEEQNIRNNLLEKKQRKFDLECQSLLESIRQERNTKERFGRSVDTLIAEKFTLEQNLADTRLELELKEEKLNTMQREIEELTNGDSEEEITQIRRFKMDLDRRVKEQEDELDEMAGQIQILEQTKLRLEMSLETSRKEARREQQQRDEELEEVRGGAYKKIKVLECQLETEHEERTLLLREKHELERRLSTLEENDRTNRVQEENALTKLKRDVRKYKALLRDAQAQLDQVKANSPGKILIRQLKNQLEDAEMHKMMAMKARQTAEAELTDNQSLLEDALRARSESDDKTIIALRERSELQAQIEENEEEISEIMKKYSSSIKQLNTQHIAASEFELKIIELESEKNSLKEQNAELQARLENIESISDPSANIINKRLELRNKELESRIELEQATKGRLEVQCNRHKDSIEKAQNEIMQIKTKELQANDSYKKSQKSLRDLRDEFHVVSNREQESETRRKDIEKRLESAKAEVTEAKNDLRVAHQRISVLQQAMEEGDSEPIDSENDSDSSEGSHLFDLEQKLKPIRSFSRKIDKNGILDSQTDEMSPRITITRPDKNGDASSA